MRLSFHVFSICIVFSSELKNRVIVRIPHLVIMRTSSNQLGRYCKSGPTLAIFFQDFPTYFNPSEHRDKHIQAAWSWMRVFYSLHLTWQIRATQQRNIPIQIGSVQRKWCEDLQSEYSLELSLTRITLGGFRPKQKVSAY